MSALPVTPAKAGAYTHRCSPDEARCVINTDNSKRMGPGLRRDDGRDFVRFLRAFAPSREPQLSFCLTQRREGAKDELLEAAE